MDFSPSALLSQIRSEDEDDYCIFSGMDDPLREADNHPYQYHHNAFKDDEFAASTDQIMNAIMEDDENNLEIAPQVFEGKISVASSSASATAAASSTTTVYSSDFFNCNYELMPSPTSFNFISMFLEEETPDDNTAVGGNLDVSNKRSRSMSKSKSQIKDHIMNERKRREKLGQLFIALAAMVPGLKKTDKGSIIVAAIENLKQLKMRETSLRNEVNKIKKKSYTEHVTAKSKEGKIQTTNDLKISSSCSSTISPATTNSTVVLEVDVKYEERKILIRLNISRKKLAIANLLNEIESIDLKVTNCYWFPFEDSYLVITIIVEMDAQFSLTTKELVTKLHDLISHK
ncbi:transcription factor NAI1-like isoform X1 [Impatiens glandulifera]|uniref:transcription factor NAI1-like isoform X1 n=1 Tax=Impatiens glandulifera TaxID=253017 RepID=UPI001FB0C69F|nr:transcription factor NAI1-like isoform X1 [Impatiens glandulifera]